MTAMTLCVTNATFESKSEGGDFGSLEDAFRSVLLAGLDIAGGEVANGANSSIVAVAVKGEDGRCLARGAVSVATQRFVLSKRPA